jgi:hypothetical protein
LRTDADLSKTVPSLMLAELVQLSVEYDVFDLLIVSRADAVRNKEPRFKF